MSIKLVCVSDSHNRHEEIKLPEFSEEELDNIIFVHAGDFTQLGLKKEVNSFELWLRGLQFKNKIVIAGNHDLSCESMAMVAKAKSHLPYYRWDEVDQWRSTQVPYRVHNAEYLNQELITINGVNFYGEPRTPEFYNWAFNVKRKNMDLVWDLVPEETHVLITHGPPLGYGDRTYEVTPGGTIIKHVGCQYQLEMLKKHPNIKVVVCGHIHSGNGSYNLVKDNGDIVKVINASVVNESYKIAYQPIIYNLEV